jgi:predicted nucleotidyltransferase
MSFDYQTIFRELSKAGIDYLIVGGLAVNLHGIPRMTYDIDIMIRLDSENITKLVERLRDWGYRPKVPVDPLDLEDDVRRDSWIQEKGMKAFNFYSESLPIGEIDLVIESPIPYHELKKRAVTFEIEGEKVPVVSIHDLITLKIKAGRKQDISDVEHLRMLLER